MKLLKLTLPLIFFFLSYNAYGQIDIANKFFAGDIVMHLEPEFPDSLSEMVVSVLVVTEDSESLLLDSVKLGDIGKHGIKFPRSGKATLIFKNSASETVLSKNIRVFPGWSSLVPPLIAILLALLTRQVLVALFFGIFSGALLLYNLNIFASFAGMVDSIIVNSINDVDRISIIIFSLVLGGMIGIVSRSGGTVGIVDKVRKYATTRKKGLLSTFLLGIFIFFDDYANTLIVGNTMRPLTDKLKISREKLSYIIDSTAAPVANIAIISTWIGYELSILNQSFKSVGLNYNPYISFIKSISFNFYPLFTLIFIFILIMMAKDYGPMYKAEKRAKDKGLLLNKDASPLSSFQDPAMAPPENIPKRWMNALVPILAVIVTTLGGLLISGYSNIPAGGFGNEISFVRKISLIVGSSNSFQVLIWAAFIGSITAMIMGLGQKLFSLHDGVEAWVSGIKAMVPAALILTAAWSIGFICDKIYTAPYVVSLTKTFLDPRYLPVMTFLTAAIIAFSTGTSWGTMAILLPIVIPTAFHLPTESGYGANAVYTLILTTFAAVLAGATFGDHCSPISDTTIMSSMASGADHIDHVRTQLPYAATVALISIIAGYLPAGFHIAPWISLTAGTIIIYLFIKLVGREV